MRVLIANHQSLPDFSGGAEQYSVWLTERLHRDSAFLPLLLSPREGQMASLCKAPTMVLPFGIFWDMLSPDGLDGRKLPVFLGEQEQAIAQLERLFRREKIELVLANTLVNVAPIVAARRAAIPVIWYIHEVFAAHQPSPLLSFRLFSDLIRKRRFSNFIRGNCQALIFNSRKSKRSFDWLPSCEPSREVEYVPVRESLFADAIDFSKPVSGDSFNVGFAGLLALHKGVLDFLRAARLALDRVPELHFTLCGPWVEEQYKRRTHEFVTEHGLTAKVTFQGIVQDMRVFYRSIDCLVMPSLYQEPFGMVALEAMAYGLPVIVYRHAGAAELILDGRNGYSVSADPRSVAARIVKLAQHRETTAQLSSAAKKTAQQYGSPDRHYDRVKRLIVETHRKFASRGGK